MNRRDFLKSIAVLGAYVAMPGTGILAPVPAAIVPDVPKERIFQIIGGSGELHRISLFRPEVQRSSVQLVSVFSGKNLMLDDAFNALNGWLWVADTSGGIRFNNDDPLSVVMPSDYGTEIEMSCVARMDNGKWVEKVLHKGIVYDGRIADAARVK